MKNFCNFHRSSKLEKLGNNITSNCFIFHLLMRRALKLISKLLESKLGPNIPENSRQEQVS
jgi:hypothetical protein